MRRLSLAIAAVLTLAGASAHAQALSVGVGQTTNLTIGGAIRDVVVGDPSIADVSLINDRTLVVMGKRAGVTSVMTFDANGRPLANRQVTVSDAGVLTVYRGAANATNYVCGEQCTRTTPARQ